MSSLTVDTSAHEMGLPSTVISEGSTPTATTSNIPFVDSPMSTTTVQSAAPHAPFLSSIFSHYRMLALIAIVMLGMMALGWLMQGMPATMTIPSPPYMAWCLVVDCWNAVCFSINRCVATLWGSAAHLVHVLVSNLFHVAQVNAVYIGSLAAAMVVAAAVFVMNRKNKKICEEAEYGIYFAIGHLLARAEEAVIVAQIRDLILYDRYADARERKCFMEHVWPMVEDQIKKDHRILRTTVAIGESVRETWQWNV